MGSGLLPFPPSAPIVDDAHSWTQQATLSHPGCGGSSGSQALIGDAQGDEQTAVEKLTAALDLGIAGRNIRYFADLGPPMADLLARLCQQGGTGMAPI